MLKSNLPDDPDERRRAVEQQAAAREASRRVQRLDAAAHLVVPAIRAVELAGLDASALRAMLQALQVELERAGHQGHGRITPRKRPAVQKQWRKEGPRHRYRLFVDESGGSRINLTHDEPFFAVGGLLVHELAYTELERRWNEWKERWIGRVQATMHARHLRKKHVRYYVRRGDPDQALEALHKSDNVAGLQVIDVLLKAVVDKLIAPETDPLRWDVAHAKLYDGGRRRIRGWGLKLFPHDDAFVESLLLEQKGKQTKTENAP